MQHFMLFSIITLPQRGAQSVVTSTFVCLSVQITFQECLAVASIARDVVVEMTPPREHNAR